MNEPADIAPTDRSARIDARLRHSQDPEERGALLRRLAKLHEEQEENYNEALEVMGRAACRLRDVDMARWIFRHLPIASRGPMGAGAPLLARRWVLHPPRVPHEDC